mmetsp:Transcript_15828/g.63749  ORF Transcript_15828/g.63749 Transcript_15828/m.63749 type:complete len:228 (-) Transcript_15828:108-791(-)
MAVPSHDTRHEWSETSTICCTRAIEMPKRCSLESGCSVGSRWTRGLSPRGRVSSSALRLIVVSGYAGKSPVIEFCDRAAARAPQRHGTDTQTKMGARTRTHDPREVARLGFAAFDVPELLRAEEVREAEADPGEPDEVLLGVDDVEDEPAEDVEALAVDDALVRRELDAAGPLLAGNDERGDLAPSPLCRVGAGAPRTMGRSSWYWPHVRQWKPRRTRRGGGNAARP